MAIYLNNYGRRPRAPRRHGPVARHAEQPGQVSTAELDRQERRQLAMRHQCPACHAPQGQPCTRRPAPREGRQRVPLGYMCHAERHALVDGVDADAP